MSLSSRLSQLAVSGAVLVPLISSAVAFPAGASVNEAFGASSDAAVLRVEAVAALTSLVGAQVGPASAEVDSFGIDGTADRVRTSARNLSVADAFGLLPPWAGCGSRGRWRQSEMDIVTTTGTDRAVRSRATIQMPPITLLQGTAEEPTVSMSEDPVLTATATGQPGGATWTWGEPTVTISRDGAVIETLDASNRSASIPSPVRGGPAIELG